MKNKNVTNNVPVKVKRMQVKKLTPDALIKITGGCVDTRDCSGPGKPTCIAYILRDM